MCLQRALERLLAHATPCSADTKHITASCVMHRSVCSQPVHLCMLLVQRGQAEAAATQEVAHAKAALEQQSAQQIAKERKRLAAQVQRADDQASATAKRLRTALGAANWLAVRAVLLV